MKAIKKIIFLILLVAFVGGVAMGLGRLATGSWDPRAWICDHTYENGICTKCGTSEPEADGANENNTVSELAETISASFSKTGQLVEPDTATGYAVVEENTYTDLPIGARNIQVGDDLSGELLFIDYPHLDYTSLLTSSVPFLTTGNYYMWRQSFSSAPFGYSSGTYISSTSIVTVNAFFTTMPYNKTDTSITAYELPADFGEVTSVDESSSIYSAFYIVDMSSLPEGTVLNYCPFEDVSFDDGTVITNHTSYADGYLAVNIPPNVLSGIPTGTELIVFDDGQRSFTVKYCTLYYCSAETENVIFTISNFDYVYVKVNMNDVSMVNTAYVTADTMRYLNENSTDTSGGDMSGGDESGGDDIVVPDYTVLGECPYPNCGFECGVNIELNSDMPNSYTDGYICVNVIFVKQLLMKYYSSERYILRSNSYNGLYIKNGTLYYAHMGNNSTGTGSELKLEMICNVSTVSYQYLYFGVDLPSVNSIDEEFVTSDIFRYLNVTSHEHTELYTECPVESCTYECALPITDKQKDECYIVINTAEYAANYANQTEECLFHVDYYSYFYIECGVLKYSQAVNGGGKGCMIRTVYDGNTNTDYVYRHLSGMQQPYGVPSYTAFKNTFGYLLADPDMITVTVETVTGSHTYEIHRYAALDVEHSRLAPVGYIWYNSKGYTMDSIPESTTFIEAYEFEFNRRTVRILNPYHYGAMITINIAGDGEQEVKSTVTYVEGYTAAGELYLLYNVERFRSIVTAYIGTLLDYTKFDVTVTTTTISLDGRNDYRKASVNLQKMVYAGNSVANTYAVAIVTGEDENGYSYRFPLARSIVLLYIDVDDTLVKEEKILVAVDFYGIVNEVYSIAVEGKYVEYYNGEVKVTFPVSALQEECSKYDNYIRSFRLDPGDMWELKTIKDEQYYEQTKGRKEHFAVEILSKSMTISNNINGNTSTVDIITAQGSEGYFVYLKLIDYVNCPKDGFEAFRAKANAFVNWDNVDTFKSAWIDIFKDVFCANGYLSLSDFNLDEEYCFTNVPEHTLIFEQVGNTYIITGILLKVPDVYVQTNRYDMRLELMSAVEFVEEGEAKPENGFTKLMGNVGDWLRGVGGGIKDFFFGGEGTTKVLNILKFIGMAVLAALLIFVIVWLLKKIFGKKGK